jgi:hypothetical protein
MHSCAAQQTPHLCTYTLKTLCGKLLCLGTFYLYDLSARNIPTTDLHSTRKVPLFCFHLSCFRTPARKHFGSSEDQTCETFPPRNLWIFPEISLNF